MSEKLKSTPLAAALTAAVILLATGCNCAPCAKAEGGKTDGKMTKLTDNLAAPNTKLIELREDGVMMFDGAVLTGKEELAEKLKQLRERGEEPTLAIKAYGQESWNKIEELAQQVKSMGFTYVGVLALEDR